MGNNVQMIFSNERQTWNVFVDGEWYYESANYEQAEQVFNSFFWNEEEDFDNEMDYEDG